MIEIDTVRSGYRNFIAELVIKDGTKNMPYYLRFLILNSLRLYVRGHGSKIGYFYCKLHSIIFRVKYRNGKPNALGRIPTLYKQTIVLAEFLKRF